jgi:hypothetical protein
MVESTIVKRAKETRERAEDRDQRDRDPDKANSWGRSAAGGEKFIPDFFRRAVITQQDGPALDLAKSDELRDVGDRTEGGGDAERESPFELFAEKANRKRGQEQRRHERGREI